MPTRSTKRRCNVHVMVWRPCRKDDGSRRFNPQKLKQVIQHVCDDYGKAETKAAVEAAMKEHGCFDECDCDEEKEECEQAKRALEELLDQLRARIIALLTAIGLALAALMSGDEESAKTALQSVDQPPDWPFWSRLFLTHLIESDDPDDVARARRSVDFWQPMFDYLQELLGDDQAAAGRCLTDLDPNSPIAPQIVNRQHGNIPIGPEDQSLIGDIVGMLRTLIRYPQE